MATGKWSTMMDAAPSSGHGQPIRMHGVDTGWDQIVEIAPINSTNLSGATQPVWLDVTDRVIDLEWDSGDPDLESRLPICQGIVRCLDISDITGDPMASQDYDRANRFGTQCLIRWGVRTPGGSWRAEFSGVIDTIVEDWSPDTPARVFELTCFDVAYFVAGYRSNVTYGSIGAQVENSALSVLSTIGFPSTRLFSGTPPPAHTWTIDPPSAPTAPLQLLHRIADSGGHVMRATPNGQLQFSPWEYSALPGGTSFHVMDAPIDLDPSSYYDLPDPADVVLVTRMRLVNSVDRLLYVAALSAPFIVGGNYTNTTLYVTDRYKQRNDSAGWPKTDVMNDNAATLPDLNAAAARSCDPGRIDQFEVDTQTAGRGAQQSFDGLMDFLTLCAVPGYDYWIERRTAGLEGYWNVYHTTAAARHLVTNDANQFRHIATVFPRFAPYIGG